MANNNPYANLSGLLGQAYQNPNMAAMRGASQAMAPMMGYTKTPTSMGQILAAMGGGAAQGQQQANMSNISMGQVQQQMNAAKAAQAKAAQTQQAMDAMAAKMGLPPGTPQAVVMEKMKAQTAGSKFGTPSVVQDSNSPTGWSSVQMNQAGQQRTVGPAKPPTSMYDPEAGAKANMSTASLTSYKDAMTQLNTADANLSNIEQMSALVDRVDSGTFASEKASFAKAAKGLGFDIDMESVSDVEAMKAKGMDFVLERIAGTKGAVSEREMTAFEEASAGIKNTREGNKKILAFAKKVSDRMKFEAEAVREAYKKNPRATPMELDDARLKARSEFGSVVPEINKPTVPKFGKPVVTSSGAIVTPMEN